MVQPQGEAAILLINLILKFKFCDATGWLSGLEAARHFGSEPSVGGVRKSLGHGSDSVICGRPRF